MEKVVVIGMILLSLSFWPITFALSKTNLMNQRNMLVGGLTTCFAVPAIAFILFRRGFRCVDPLMYAFGLFSWISMASLAVALEMDGYISKLIAHYLKDGEPYLKTAHGIMACYWDGTVQYIAVIACIVLYTQRESHREVGLYWAGSILNSMAVLFPACLTGREEIKTPMLLHIVMALVPFFATVRFLHNRPLQARTFLKFSPLWKRPVDLLFFIYFLWALGVAVFRGMAVLGGNVAVMKQYLKTYEPYLMDPTNFPKFQVITYEYIFLMYYLVTLYGLMYPGQHWMADLSILHAGAAAQAQFTYIAGSLHSKTPKDFRAPMSGQAAYVFFTVNILLFIVPHLFTFWCQRDAEKHGRTYTVDLATPKNAHITYSHSRKSTWFQQKDD